MRQSDGMKSSIILVFEIGPTRLLRVAQKKDGPLNRYYEEQIVIKICKLHMSAFSSAGS